MTSDNEYACPLCGNSVEISVKNMAALSPNLGPLLFKNPIMNLMAREGLSRDSIRIASNHGIDLSECDFAGDSLLHVWAWYADEHDYILVPELVDWTGYYLHEENDLGQTPAMIWLKNLGEITQDDVDFLVECGWKSSLDLFADAYIRNKLDPYSKIEVRDEPLDL